MSRTVVHTPVSYNIYFATKELSCRQSRVPKPYVQLTNRGIYVYDNRDPINQGLVYFLSVHFELTPFSDGQLSNVSVRPPVFNWENDCLRPFVMREFFLGCKQKFFAFKFVFALWSEEIEPALLGMSLTTLEEVPRPVSRFSRVAVAKRSD